METFCRTWKFRAGLTHNHGHNFCSLVVGATHWPSCCDVSWQTRISSSQWQNVSLCVAVATHHAYFYSCRYVYIFDTIFMNCSQQIYPRIEQDVEPVVSIGAQQRNPQKGTFLDGLWNIFVLWNGQAPADYVG